MIEQIAQGSTQQYYFAKALMSYADGLIPEVYPGELTKRLGEDIGRVVPTSWGIELWKVYGSFRAIAEQHEDLEVFGAFYNKWKAETSLHDDSVGGLPILQMNCALGLVYQVSPITDQPICGNCATVLTPFPEANIAKGTGACYSCPLCNKIPLFNRHALYHSLYAVPEQLPEYHTLLVAEWERRTIPMMKNSVNKQLGEPYVWGEEARELSK